MPGQFHGLPVRMLQIGRDLFCITSPFRFERPCGLEIAINMIHRDGHTLGFVSDGGSKPAIVHSIVGSHTDEGFAAYVVHDWLYRARIYGNHSKGRAMADRVLLEALEVCGVPFWKRRIIHAAVRLFGWSVWRQRDPIDLGRIHADQPGPDFYIIPPGAFPTGLRFRMLRLKDKSGTTARM